MNFDLGNIIQHILQSADIPLLTAFVLGILVALNPCQLAISISALTYEYKRGNTLKEGLIYALGRSITYCLLGWITMCLIGGGKNLECLTTLFSYVEITIPYILVVISIYLIIRAVRPHHHEDNCHNSSMIIKRNGPLGSLILGMTLALAFCPESAIFYFGMMIPLSINSSIGIAIPLVFALSASIPVAIIAWIMSKTTKGAQSMSHRFEHFQQWLNAITALLFFLLAVWIWCE